MHHHRDFAVASKGYHKTSCVAIHVAMRLFSRHFHGFAETVCAVGEHAPAGVSQTGADPIRPDVAASTVSELVRNTKWLVQSKMQHADNLAQAAKLQQVATGT